MKLLTKIILLAIPIIALLVPTLHYVSLNDSTELELNVITSGPTPIIKNSDLELPDDFVTEYQGRDVVMELNMTHADTVMTDDFKPRLAKAMFTIRNMTENERGEININLLFLQ